MLKTSFIRHASRFALLIAMVPTWASGQDRHKGPPPADAGTSPVLGVGQPGDANYQPAQAPGLRLAAAQSAVFEKAAIDLLQKLRGPGGGPAFSMTLEFLQAASRLQHAGGRLKMELARFDAHPELKDEVKELDSQIAKLDAGVDATSLNAVAAAAEALRKKASSLAMASLNDKELLGIKVGIYAQPGATYQFASVLYSLPEHFVRGTSDGRSSIFFTGTELAHLGSSGPMTGRLGIGALSGDPNQALMAMGLASFFASHQPEVTDVGANLSAHVLTLGSDRGRGQRYLVDHIRSGDLWLSGGVRFLVSNDPTYTGTALDGAVNIGLPRMLRLPGNEIPTLSVTGTYCSQENLGLDEYGIELRFPFEVRRMCRKPLHLSARYGTRNDITIGLGATF